MRRLLTPTVVCLWLALACQNPSAKPASEHLTVFAASSLTEAFAELGEAFARKEHSLPPKFAVAGSQSLRLQIEQGAQADVFASANGDHMSALASSGIIAQPEIFAYNELVLIVPKDNPASIRKFEDLPRARRLVVGAPAVPIGQYTRELLQRAEHAFGPAFSSSARKRVVSEETNVRLVRAKVELGEADAAIVYRTDATDRVQTIEIPASLNVRAGYQIGLVGSEPTGLAKRWMLFISSPAGRTILARHGFATP